MAEPRTGSGDHWVVRMNYRNRTISFLGLGAMLALHVHHAGYDLLHWGLLAANFLLMPHLLFWRSRRASDPLRTEIQNTYLDSAVFGLWTGMVGFSHWLTFVFLIGGLLNPAAFRGSRGLIMGGACYTAGTLLGWLLGGMHYAPDTSAWVRLVAAVATLYFLVTFGLGTYGRSVALHQTREELKRREIELEGQLEEIRGLEAKLREQAIRDPLTGLYNRRYFEPTLERELTRCLRDGVPLALILADIDHFKSVNDRYGHPAGDAVLRQIGEVFGRRVRAPDVAARIGGEEFALVLPGMDEAAATARAEQLRAEWSTVSVNVEGVEIRSTISIGIAVAPAVTSTMGDLVRSADHALYSAKQAGRNRVVVHGSLVGNDAKVATNAE